MANTVVVSTVDSQMVDEPLWMQATGGDAAISYAAADDRAFIDSLFIAEGVLVVNASAFKVSQRGAGANFSVDVASGKAVVTGDDGTNQRKYVVISNGTVNVVTPSAPGSGTRVHRIIIRIRDKQVIGSGTYDWTIELLEDTGSGTPAQPNSAITLALVSIAAAQASVLNANITDSRPPAQGYGPAGSAIARGRRITSSSTTTTTVGVLRFDAVQVWAGHTYRVALGGSTVPASTVANDGVQFVLRFTTDGTTATTASTIVPGGAAAAFVGSTTIVQTLGLSTTYTPSANQSLSILLCVTRASGTGSVSIFADANFLTEMLVEDLSLDPPTTVTSI